MAITGLEASPLSTPGSLPSAFAQPYVRLAASSATSSGEIPGKTFPNSQSRVRSRLAQVVRRVGV